MTEPTEIERWAAVTASLNTHAASGLISMWIPGPAIAVILGNDLPVTVSSIDEAESFTASLDETATLLEGLGWRPCE